MSKALAFKQLLQAEGQDLTFKIRQTNGSLQNVVARGLVENARADKVDGSSVLAVDMRVLVDGTSATTFKIDDRLVDPADGVGKIITSARPLRDRGSIVAWSLIVRGAR